MGKTTDQNVLSEVPSPEDVIDIVRVSDTTDSPEGSSKQITIGLILLAAGLKRVAGYEGYVIIAASGNTDISIVEENDLLVGSGAYRNGAHVSLRALKDEPSLELDFADGLNVSE